MLKFDFESHFKLVTMERYSCEVRECDLPGECPGSLGVGWQGCQLGGQPQGL